MRWDDGEPMTQSEVKRELAKCILALAVVFGAWVLTLWLLPG